MASSPESETLLSPQNVAGSTTGRSGGLSTHIQSQSVQRLRTLALLYAFVFFMAAFFPALLFAHDRAMLFGDPANWVPGVISITVGLIVAILVRSSRIPLPVVMDLGLAFEVVSSFGIAIAEFLEPTRLNMNGWIGLSWVAVWVPLFTTLVPTQPLRAAVALLASLSSVPVVIGFMVATGRTSFSPNAPQFFFNIVFPYLLVALMAYVGSCVVYALGREVTIARQMGSYRLVERLGQGGMGEVWKAQHRLLARPAAIKLIQPSLSSNAEEARRRFEREAQVTASLQSPHTVELFDFGVAEDGAFYYVMELLDGLDLETLVKRFGPVPVERAVHFLRQICHSLAEAESCGLVHRDIKPANIFVCRYGGDYDFVKVLDFGIVKGAHDSMETAPAVTVENMVRGTPAFIAPEQALGGPNVDSRADIYATGCVAYWLLTGQLVFTADSAIGLLLHHARTQPAPPSARAEQPIPPALDQIVLSCLAKNPADRPQSAKELSRRLAEVTGADAWTEDRAQAWWIAHQPASLSAH